MQIKAIRCHHMPVRMAMDEKVKKKALERM